MPGSTGPGHTIWNEINMATTLQETLKDLAAEKRFPHLAALLAEIHPKIKEAIQHSPTGT